MMDKKCCSSPTCDSCLSPPFTTPINNLKCGSCGKSCQECIKKEKPSNTIATIAGMLVIIGTISYFGSLLLINNYESTLVMPASFTWSTTMPIPVDPWWVSLAKIAEVMGIGGIIMGTLLFCGYQIGKLPFCPLCGRPR
jgi:hypothetical protein